jgi:hypothetical protein
MNKKTQITIVALVVALVAFTAGYSYGMYKGIDIAISYGTKFVDIDVDTDMLTKALYQYKEQIGGCLFTQDAFIHNNTWNQE